MAYYIDWSKKKKLKKTTVNENGDKVPLHSYCYVYKEGYDAQGKPINLIERRFRFSTDREAKRFLAEWAVQMQKGDFRKEKNISFETFATIWESDHLTTKRKSTQTTESQLVKNYVIPAIGNCILEKVTPRELHNIIHNMISIKNGVTAKPAYKLRLYNVLLDIFGLAMKWQYIGKNPMKNVDRPKVPTPRYEAPAEDHELQIVLDAILKHGTLRHRMMIEIPLYLGLRRGEMMALEWSSIDFEEGTMKIQQNWTGEIGELKTEQSERTLDIPPSLIEDLKEYRRVWLEQQMLYGHRADFLFYNHEKGKIYDKNAPTKWLKRLVNTHNLPKLTIKDMRTMYSTILVKNGESPIVLQHNLGHTTPKTSITFYTKIQETTKKAAADRMDKYRLTMQTASE